MDTQDHIDAIRNCGHDLANAIKAATDAEVSPAVILPTLIGVLQDSGLMPEGGLPFPNLTF